MSILTKAITSLAVLMASFPVRASWVPFADLGLPVNWMPSNVFVWVALAVTFSAYFVLIAVRKYRAFKANNKRTDTHH